MHREALWVQVSGILIRGAKCWRSDSHTHKHTLSLLHIQGIQVASFNALLASRSRNYAIRFMMTLYDLK